jgi:phosphoserine aminotransferase
VAVTDTIKIPADLLPADGRFGCGPSKVRPEAVAALAAAAPEYLGTSHRQPTVLFEVGALRNHVAELFSLPDGYEVLLSNGGSTYFWDAATFGLIEQRSQHLVFGEFSSKFFSASKSAPHLGEPSKIEAPAGDHSVSQAEEGIDVYAMTHNETSTGVMMPLVRPTGIDDDALVVVDATSAAGGLRVNMSEVDVYYFAPQKCLASDGGLWIACCSPRAIERIQRISATDRWRPASLDLGIALENSRKDQTYNTPALSTIFLANQQLQWVLQNGGLEFAAGRSDSSANTLYSWAEAHAHATPFVTDPTKRSRVVATIDFDESIDAKALAATLRANGVLDVEPYRKLGRNQLRVAMFPAIDPSDIEALTACIDYAIENL